MYPRLDPFESSRVETFSSTGPCIVNGDTRNKPDTCAADALASTTVGGWFSGHWFGSSRYFLLALCCHVEPLGRAPPLPYRTRLELHYLRSFRLSLWIPFLGCRAWVSWYPSRSFCHLGWDRGVTHAFAPNQHDLQPHSCVSIAREMVDFYPDLRTTCSFIPLTLPSLGACNPP